MVVEGKADSDRFYIIQRGQVQCYKSSGSGIQPFMLGPGDFVGVVPCMSGHFQIETAVAVTDVVAIAVRNGTEQLDAVFLKKTGFCELH